MDINWVKINEELHLEEPKGLINNLEKSDRQCSKKIRTYQGVI